MPLTLQERRLERLQRRLEELRSWRNASEVPVNNWVLEASDHSTHPCTLGDVWPLIETPVQLRATAEIPAAWSGLPVELELSLGGEGLVRLSTGYQAGLNPFHHRFPVMEMANGGERIDIEAEIVPKGIMGSHIHRPSLERAMIVVPHREVRALERDLTMLREACIQLADHEVAPLLLDAAESALSVLARDWPTNSAVSVSRYVLGYEDGVGAGIHIEEDLDWIPEATDVRRPKRPTWSYPPSPQPLGPLPDAAIRALNDSRETLESALQKIRLDYPPVGSLCLTGHAHIDLAWLWPASETRRKTQRTFSTVLDLMNRYPDFTFNQSSAQVYEWIAEDDPELFDQIRARVLEGRWEPSGGMWVESDANITGGEAFVRQLLYGQRYFEQTFGRRNRAAWLPDVFGYSGGMPQLLIGAGITGFFTTKLNWSEANQFPHDLFEWEGIDGSLVTVHTFFNPGHGYNGNIAPLDTLGTWRNFRGKTVHRESLLSFGWGDGAGGPSEKMLENYNRIKDFPALPKLRMGHIDDFFASLPTSGLPRWVGELYLELHRGTLTTQARTKALNRASEHRLLEAEAFGAIAQLGGFDYPAENVESAWKSLLLNQFHDILPGSSINEVYQDTHRMLEDVVSTATRVRDSALTSLGSAPGSGQHLIVANAGLSPRPLQVLVRNVDHQTEITDHNGKNLPSQPVVGGLLVSATGALVPGLGWTSLTLSPTSESSPPVNVNDAVSARMSSDGTSVLENSMVRVEIGNDGSIARMLDKNAQREILRDRGNQLWAYVDRPYTYDAWDIDETYERDGEEVLDVHSLDILEDGPLRASVRVSRHWRDSVFQQTYRLWTDTARLDIETHIEWHERQVLLKARFPLLIRTQAATYETMYGSVRRPTHRNNSWDAAQFEVCGHRFADMSEPGFGVALLNNGKYGHEAHGDTLSLTLLRSPLFPDPLADEGDHKFIYSLFPHAGDWADSGVVDEAFRLNSPLIVSTTERSVEPSSFVRVEGTPLGLGSLKPSLDGSGIVLRVYEPYGARGRATLRFNRSIAECQRVNLLEEPMADGIAGKMIDEQTIELNVRPFEVISLRLMFH